MKRIFKSVAIWIVVGEALITFVLWCMGFRITYAPELDNNWVAISAVADVGLSNMLDGIATKEIVGRAIV